MNSIDAAEPRHDLGVLFVHGIGQSKQGETLLSFGEPLRRAVEHLVEPSASTPGAGAATSVSAAWLSEPGDDAPARAEISIEGAAGAAGSGPAASSRWLLAEAWWAEQFPTPTYADIASWSFGVLPATLVSHVGPSRDRGSPAQGRAAIALHGGRCLCGVPGTQP